VDGLAGVASPTIPVRRSAAAKRALGARVASLPGRGSARRGRGPRAKRGKGRTVARSHLLGGWCVLPLRPSAQQGRDVAHACSIRRRSVRTETPARAAASAWVSSPERTRSSTSAGTGIGAGPRPRLPTPARTARRCSALTETPCASAAAVSVDPAATAARACLMGSCTGKACHGFMRHATAGYSPAIVRPCGCLRKSCRLRLQGPMAGGSISPRSPQGAGPATGRRHDQHRHHPQRSPPGP